ncbi:MAG TPA: BatA domain-containing protein [Phycisphaerae bacterium]|mgnify:FL=1|nr:BatA domain-containing protein [Phycisphaerae bacterium]
MFMMAGILAAMVTPALLVAGAAAMSVPILIHLLTRRRFQRVRWAATDFLLEAERQNRRRVRIEEIILLALRCLAMLLIGLMLARVFVQPEALAAMLGGRARSERIVVLDDSFSMGLKIRGEGRGARDEGRGARDEGRGAGGEGGVDEAPGIREATVFGRAKAAVERLAHWLRDESPEDSFTIVLTSRPDRPLRVETAVGKMDFNALAAELEGLAPSSRAGNLPATMESVRRLLEGRQGHVNATVYVVSDFQRVDWIGGDPAGEGRSAEPSGSPGADEPNTAVRLRNPAAVLASWAGQGRSLRMVLVDTGIKATHNLCVTAIEPQQAQAVAGVSTRYIVRVTNFGQTDAQPSALRVYVGDAAQPAVAVPVVPAGEHIEVPVEVTFPAEGADAVTVELDPDPLPVDNSRTLAVPVTRALRVLVINGEAAADPFQDEVYLLLVAMRPEGPQFSGNDVTVMDENELETVNLSAYHVVLLANVYRITEEAAARLEHFVAAGGGVGIFLGDQVDPDIYNRILYRDGKGLMPAQLGEVISAPQDQPGFGLVDVDETHSLIRRFADPRAGLLRGVLAWRFVAAQPAMQGALSAGETPGPHEKATPGGQDARPPKEAHPPGGAPARVLLRFEDPDRRPALVERSFGNGRVVLWTSTIDKEWTNLPNRPVFVVLAMELAQYLARPPAQGGEQLVGEPIRLRLDPARYRPVVTLQSPRYPEEPAVRIEALPDPDDNLPTIYWAETGQPGLYRFELTDTSGSEVLEQMAINVDPRESNLQRADRAALLDSLSGLPAEYVTGEALLHQGDDQARRELWPSLLIALVAVLMLEQALAVWFGSDRNWRALWRGRGA